MLVLLRKPGESIRIGRDITVMVLQSVGESVRIGIEAPRHIDVLRAELAPVLSEEWRRLDREIGDSLSD